MRTLSFVLNITFVHVSYVDPFILLFSVKDIELYFECIFIQCKFSLCSFQCKATVGYRNKRKKAIGHKFDLLSRSRSCISKISKKFYFVDILL